MSVINQMLKDLDQRQVEQSASIHNANIANVTPHKSNKKIALMVILAILFLNVAGWYVWNLYHENQSLKEHKELQNEPSILNNNSIKVSQITKDNIESNHSAKVKGASNTPQSRVIKAEEKPITIASEQINSVVSKPIVALKDKKIKQVSQPQNKSTSQDKKITHKAVSETGKTFVTPIPKNTRNSDVEEITEENENKASLTISRSQLSPERLAQQKVERAEQAINNNEIQKAEKLFEDVLLILPEHKSARKQLGALWFGRKLYRPAVNLLSRGITLHPEDIDFRLMKARILLNQNSNTEAFNVLNGFAMAKDVEYQVLLANTSQLVKRNESVILAYQQLVDMEEHKGRWWLGLAVAFDRNSQFTEAKSAYKNALIKDDLSDGSDDFIRQRLNELGE